MKYEKYLQIVLRSCVDVFKEMAKKQIVGQVKLTKPEHDVDDFAIAIVVPYKNPEENLEGKFVLGFTDKKTATMLASPIAENMGLLPPIEYDDMVSDILFEFMNTVVGQAITEWDSLGLSVDFGSPYATEGDTFCGENDMKREVYSIFLNVNDNSVVITVSFEESANSILRGKKVLVVDDSRTIRFYLSKELKKEGCHIIEAENGVEGVRQFESSKPDLTIMDLVMPEMGGLDAIANIKKLDPEANILVLTSSAKKSQVIAASKLKVKGYIKKPIKADMLLDLARNSLIQK